MIFNRIVKKSGNHHIFGNRDTGESCLTHDQGSDSKKMRHVRNACSLASLNMEVTSIIDCARESIGKVQCAILDVCFGAGGFHWRLTGELVPRSGAPRLVSPIWMLRLPEYSISGFGASVRRLATRGRRLGALMQLIPHMRI